MPQPDWVCYSLASGQHSRQVEDCGQRGQGPLRDSDPDSEAGGVHGGGGGVSPGARLLQHPVHPEKYLSQVSVLCLLFTTNQFWVNLVFLGFLCMIHTITISLSPSRHSSFPPPAPATMAHSLMLTRPDIRHGQKLGSHLFYSSVDITCSSE